MMFMTLNTFASDALYHIQMYINAYHYKKEYRAQGDDMMSYFLLNNSLASCEGHTNPSSTTLTRTQLFLPYNLC